jgi:hypothetical protein
LQRWLKLCDIDELGCGGNNAALQSSLMLSLQAAVMGAIAADVRRGALIVLEGLDRSGKSSQCSRLTSFLHTQGLSVEAWRFPDRSTPMGKMISSYLSSQMDLDDASIHLLFSANRWEKRLVYYGKTECRIFVQLEIQRVWELIATILELLMAPAREEKHLLERVGGH